MSIDRVQIEKSLNQRLKTRLAPDEINTLADVIAELSNSGIEVDDVFPYGIPPQRELGIRARQPYRRAARQTGRLNSQARRSEGLPHFPARDCGPRALQNAPEPELEPLSDAT
ncbi:MAG: hypothetical protein V7631_3344 [Massilia sp.]